MPAPRYSAPLMDVGMLEGTALDSTVDLNSFVVRVGMAETGRPFFIIPGGWGGENEVLVFATLLSHLRINRPGFAVLSRALDETWPLPSTFEEQASAIYAAIRTLQARGPYLLIGECVAGSLAMEVARQAELAEEVAGTVIVLDPPHLAAQPSGSCWRWQEDNPLSDGPNEALHPPLPARIDEYYRLLSTWKPAPIRSALHLVISSSTLHIDALARDWGKLTRSSFQVHTTQGDHHSYIRNLAEDTAAVVEKLIVST